MEGGLFADLDKINKAEVSKLLKELKQLKSPKEEIEVCETYLKLLEQDSNINYELKVQQKALENKVVAKYPLLTETEIKLLVVEHKWKNIIAIAVKAEMERVSQALTQRIKELAERYENPMPQLKEKVNTLEQKVNEHLAKIGLVWN